MAQERTQVAPQRGPFWAGVRAALPLLLGITPYGIAFGLLGPTVGLSATATVAMSAIVFAGSSQFVALGLLQSGTGHLFIVLSTLVVNLRHLLYAGSIAPYFRRLSPPRKALASFLLADETYALAIAHFRRPGASPSAEFYLGLGLTVYLDWVLSTAAGLAVGGLVPDPTALGLDFALPATFIGLVVPQLRDRAAWATCAVSAAIALLARGLPGRLDILLATIVAATVGWGVETWRTRS